MAGMTLTEFLEARFAEDEAMVRTVLGVLPVELSRTLAECEAKRRIVERCNSAIENDPHDRDDPEWVTEVIDSLTWATLYDLALPYEDHPDYLDEWKP